MYKNGINYHLIFMYNAREDANAVDRYKRQLSQYKMIEVDMKKKLRKAINALSTQTNE